MSCGRPKRYRLLIGAYGYLSRDIADLIIRMTAPFQGTSVGLQPRRTSEGKASSIPPMMTRFRGSPFREPSSLVAQHGNASSDAVNSGSLVKSTTLPPGAT